MLDETTHQERLKRGGTPAGLTGILQSRETEADEGESSCAAFGYLRGIRERADAVQLRFRDGNSTWFPYSSLGNWKYNPSEGLLLKFTVDVVCLVLIRGSNLDKPLSDSTTNLTTSGLQRHRITWMREMTEKEIREIGETEPTIASIQVAEFESHAALKEWLKAKAPAFAQGLA